MACGRPVIADAVAQLDDMALQVEFVLLQPGDVELLPARAALELARDVLFVVADDSAVCQRIIP